MDFIENDYEPKEEESKDLFKISLTNDNDNYLLKIFPSKDNISIIFKLEKENIKSYYYYRKLYLSELKKINKKFNSDNNIINAFIRIKIITQNNKCLLEKKSNKIKILFINNNFECNIFFILKKKIVSQNRLNMQLLGEIQDNETKINLLKKQIVKLDKTIQYKNKLIDKINNNTTKITNVINEININLKNTNSPNNIKIENKNNDIKKLNENQNIENIKKNLKKESELLKSNDKDDKYDKKMKKYKINIYQKSNLNNQEDTLFFLDNIDVLHNKKIYETLIAFNIITVLIIIYLLYLISELREGLIFVGGKDDDIAKKITFLNFLEDMSDVEMSGIRENIIDFQLKNNENDTYNNSNKYKKLIYNNIKRKIQENKEYSLFYNEKEKRYFKKNIKRRISYRIRGIDLELKYNSKESYKYTNLYNSYKYFPEILILFKTKEGKRYGVFCNNIILYNEKSSNNHRINEYVGYAFNKEHITEINLQEFFDNYVSYLQNIYNYLKVERLYLKTKQIIPSKEILGDIDIFEIYQVKHLK